MNEKVANALDRYLGVNTAAFVALGTLCVSLLVGGAYVGQVYSEVERARAERGQICLRIKDCIPYTTFPRLIEAAKDIAAGAVHSVNGLSAEINSYKSRTIVLEQKVYDLVTKPSARSDPFTGTDGEELSRRIKTIEDKINHEL